MAMAKQNSLDDVGLDLDDADDDFEDTPDSGNLEGFGKDSPRPGTPITVEGMHFQVFIYRISLMGGLRTIKILYLRTYTVHHTHSEMIALL